MRILKKVIKQAAAGVFALAGSLGLLGSAGPLMGFAALGILGHAAPASAEDFGIFKSDGPSPFKVPAAYAEKIGDYRKNFIRLTRVEFSGLHWNQAIVVYINRDYKTFVDNYIGYLKLNEGLEDELPCAPGESPEESGCVDLFSAYNPGTIVLKENYQLEAQLPHTPISVTAMIKHEPGYDPAGGDWEYLQFDVQGSVGINGKSADPAVNKTCAECHLNMIDRDFIFSTFYKTQGDNRIPKKK